MQYYETLGLARSAEPQVIDAAYKAMMRRYHPDVFDGSRDYAEQTAKRLNEAYGILKDPLKRAEYDRALGQSHRQSAPQSPPRQPKPESRPQEPWDWESDPLGLRTKIEVKKDWSSFKVVGGAIAFMFMIAGIESIF